jgi:hypothetical protein
VKLACARKHLNIGNLFTYAFFFSPSSLQTLCTLTLLLTLSNCVHLSLSLSNNEEPHSHNKDEAPTHTCSLLTLTVPP